MSHRYESVVTVVVCCGGVWRLLYMLTVVAGRSSLTGDPTDITPSDHADHRDLQTPPPCESESSVRYFLSPQWSDDSVWALLLQAGTMRHPGEDRQDHLRHLQPGQHRRPHRPPPLGHLRPHLDKPHTDHHSLDCRAEMGPHGKLILRTHWKRKSQQDVK